MERDSGARIEVLRTDGGMVGNELLMQFQSDILNLPVVRPKMRETTALGAAYAAGLAVGYFGGTEELKKNWRADREWGPAMHEALREEMYRKWKRAVTRSFEWET